MAIKYITEPLPKFVTRIKPAGAKYTRTTYTCPLCNGPFPKKDFEDHVRKTHGSRLDECFARLFGLPWPYRCACGKDLRYSSAQGGFPDKCGSCSTGNITTPNYKDANDAHNHVEQLKQLLANAEAEEKRLKREAEMEKIPLEELPFPSAKYVTLMRRLSKAIRINAVNGDQEKLLELANFLDKKLKDMVQ